MIKGQVMREEFYKWCMSYFNKDNEEEVGTHPLNWMTLVLNISDFKDKIPLPKEMIEAFKKILVGKKYYYTVCPLAYKKGEKIKIDKFREGNLFPTYYGNLILDNDKFYLDGFENRKVSLKNCWIINEVT